MVRKSWTARTWNWSATYTHIRHEWVTDREKEKYLHCNKFVSGLSFAIIIMGQWAALIYWLWRSTQSANLKSHAHAIPLLNISSLYHFRWLVVVQMITLTWIGIFPRLCPMLLCGFLFSLVWPKHNIASQIMVNAIEFIAYFCFPTTKKQIRVI